MLKYVDTAVTLAEVPDEITLCIDISNCPCNCKNCHSSYLAEDIGIPLTTEKVSSIIDKNEGISCVCLMGGDANPEEVNNIASYIKSRYDILKVAWYSGRQELSKYIELKNFDYIKLGPYIEEKGPLNNPNTNQKFYEVCRLSKLPEIFCIKNITDKFWK